MLVPVPRMVNSIIYCTLLVRIQGIREKQNKLDDSRQILTLGTLQNSSTCHQMDVQLVFKSSKSTIIYTHILGCHAFPVKQLVSESLTPHRRLASLSQATFFVGFMTNFRTCSVFKAS